MARIPSAVLRLALVVAGGFNALSALAGLFALTVGGGLGMPPEYMGPFDSFVIPGLILGIVVGGTQSWSTVALARRTADAPLATAVAGLGMQIWIVVEIGLINDFVWLHALYFATGTTQLALLLGLLGVAPWLVADAWAAGSEHTGGRGPDAVTSEDGSQPQRHP